MRFITLGDGHINLDYITSFYWNEGVLVIGDFAEKHLRLDDPDRKLYKTLSRAVGVAPKKERKLWRMKSG